MRVTLLLFLILSLKVVIAQPVNDPSNINLDSFINARQTAPLGKLFPKFTATSGERTVSNDLFKGKIVLINFWFEGCHPCMAEMGALVQLQQQLKNNKDFLFVSFTRDNRETITRVKKKYGITFSILSASEKECSRLNFENGYPTNLILDRTGTIKYLHAGGYTNKEKAKEFIMKTLLSEIKSEL